MSQPDSQLQGSDIERVRTLLAMKSGPREYTAEQAEFMERAVQNRKPLPGTALPIEEDHR